MNCTVKHCTNRQKYKPFGMFLKTVRQERGWTLQQLYVKVNLLSSKDIQIISYDSLKRWEGGYGIPQIESAVALAKVLNKPELIKLRVDAVELAIRKNPHELALTRI